MGLGIFIMCLKTGSLRHRSSAHTHPGSARIGEELPFRSTDTLDLRSSGRGSNSAAFRDAPSKSEQSKVPGTEVIWAGSSVGRSYVLPFDI